MPCSICHQCGHNKRTCPQLITFKEVEVVVAPLKIFNSSVEVEIGFLCLRFQLPKEVELVIQRLSRARPLLTQHDIEFSQSKLERLAPQSCRAQEWREQGRKNSIEEAILIPTEGRWCGRGFGERDFKKRVKMEWGKGTSKNKTEYQLYFATLQMTEASHRNRQCAPKIANNYSIDKIGETIRTIEKEIEIRKGATGATSLREIISLKQSLEGCWSLLKTKEEQERLRPFKKLTMKSIVPVTNDCRLW